MAGFGRNPDQTILIYTSGWTERDWFCPLVVVIAPAGAAQLVATERRQGTPIDLGLPGVTAVHHDGLWTAPETEIGAPAKRPVWNTTFAHSITARSMTLTAAVRANKQRVDTAELVRVLLSLTLT